MSEHQTCRETNAREKTRMGGLRSKASAQDTFAPQSSDRLGARGRSGEALFKGRTQNRPKRTLTWKLGVDAKFVSGGFQVQSFSGTFSGAKATVGGKARN